MKATEGRIRALTFLAKPGAYAMPNGFVPHVFTDMPRNFSITSDMLGMMEANGYIERGKPPQGGKVIFAWRITTKGLKWLWGARPKMERSFSDFIRNAPTEEKEAVYMDVMQKATDRQNSSAGYGFVTVKAGPIVSEQINDPEKW